MSREKRMGAVMAGDPAPAATQAEDYYSSMFSSLPSLVNDPSPAARPQVTMTGAKVSRTYRPAPYEAVTFDMELVVPEITVDDRQAVCGIYAQALQALDEAFRRNFQATKQ